MSAQKEEGQEMNKMIAFIMQEALDKVSELELKGEEEHNIEKAKIVRQNTSALEEKAHKKKKEFLRQKQIRDSGQKTKTSLEVLEVKRELIDSLFDEAECRVKARLAKDGALNGAVLSRLISEAVEQIALEEAVVRCLERDFPLVRQICEDKAGIEASLFFMQEAELGGVIVESKNSNIWCKNTIKSRLDMAKEKLLPRISSVLFGCFVREQEHQ
ncbi:MAG: V-type proton ATPase subunit E [Amphiamblys sp. WSBS2006]|nr:MAG: V-type proton ATPase subunit E [Amphiamblys sp. WSBS2006]